MKKFRDIIDFLIENKVQFSVSNYVDPDSFNINIQGNYWSIDVAPSIDYARVIIVEKTINNKENKVPLLNVEMFLMVMSKVINTGFDLSFSEIMKNEVSSTDLVRIIKSLSRERESSEIHIKGKSVTIQDGEQLLFQFELSE